MAIRDYINEDEVGLMERIDLQRMLGDLGRGTVVAIMSGMMGIVLAFRDGFVAATNSFQESFGRLNEQLAMVFPELMRDAISVASSDLSQFGIATAPVTTIVVISVFVAIPVGFILFWDEWFA